MKGQKPDVQSRARMLSKYLKEQGVELKHSLALEVIARMEGDRDWHTCSARLAEEAKELQRFTRIGQTTELLYIGDAKPWQIEEGSEEHMTDGDHCEPMQLQIEKLNPSQFSISLSPFFKEIEELEGKPQLGLWVEINEGLPCVHVSGDLYGDSHLSIFAAEDALILRANNGQFSQFVSETTAVKVKQVCAEGHGASPHALIEI